MNKIKITTKIICVFCFLLIINSCDKTKYTYSSYHCNLTIDNGIHNDITLASAMNAMSPGVFCKITHEYQGGAFYFVFENTSGSKTKKIFNAIDQRLQSGQKIGMNNGLIVGYSAFDNAFIAYDLQCSKCFNFNDIPLKNNPLTLTNSAQAKCNNCGSVYNLNVTGNGLTQYRTSTSGPFGVLHVY